MYCVYLLQLLKNKSLYIGCTSDLKKRLLIHNQGKSIYTKKHMPWKLIYCEAYISKQDAFSREKALKLHKQGLYRLKERLHYTLEI